MRRFQDVSISRKLVVVMLATATVALLLATVGFTAHQVVSFRRSMSARLSSLAGILGANSAGALAFQDADAAERVLHSVDGQRDIVSACLYAEAALLAEYRRSSAAGCPDDVGAFGTAADATLVRVQPVMYEDDQIGVIALVADRRELAAMLEQDAIIVLVLLMVGLGATWGMAAFLQRLISRPVLHLVGVATSVTTQQDYSVRAIAHGQDEIGLLSRSFNDMLDQIKTDIDQRKQTMAQLEASGRDLERASQAAQAATKAKSAFLATMSHEIRTPMNGVVGMTELLADTPLTAQQREYTSMIRSSGEALVTIINDILDFSKIEAGRLDVETTDFNLYGATEQAVDLLAERAHAQGVELTVRFDQAVPLAVAGDPGRLRQVLTNLIGNAVKFTEHGAVSVQVGVEQEDDDTVLVRVAVSDTGIGISGEALARLFQPFSQADSSTTRRFGGTGLGLAISKRLVELMGGTIDAESVEGEGSTFRFTLPFEKRATLPMDPTLEGMLRGLRVLAVDDNAANRALLERSLGVHGLSMDTERHPTQALARLRTAADGGRPYGLVLADVMMPNMDGLELGRQAKADSALPGCPLILLTGADDVSVEDAAAAGFAACLTTPIRQAQLLASVQSVLAESADAHSVNRQQGVTTDRPTETSARTDTQVLVAEDNAVNQKVAVLMLEKLGCTVDIVPNGREAVEAVTRHPYDIVLMDCQMPELDGFGATAEIRRLMGEERRIPIIAMTANAMQGDRERCLAAGMDDYIAKPVKSQALSDALRRWASTKLRRTDALPAA